MNPSIWPRPVIEELESFFGKIQLGEDGQPVDRWKNGFLQRVLLPYPMRLAWEPDHRITKVLIHREVAGSLNRCLGGILKLYEGDPEQVRAVGLDCYGGAYAYRRSAGTNFLSMHSYGAAFDFCLPDGEEMPIEVIEIFAAEGWAWGGDNKKRPEPGHFEAINRS